MRAQILVDNFIKPALAHLAGVKPSLDSPNARQMLLAIAAQESSCGKYFAQLGGPAQGPWQIEPRTHDDLFTNFLDYRPDLRDALEELLPTIPVDNVLVSSPLYCCGVARMLMYREPWHVPALNDRDGMWALYKEDYNTRLGKATKAEWDHNWAKYVEGTNVR